MEFLKALIRAKELGLTKEEFIPIWKLEANMKASELEDQQPIQSPVRHTNSDWTAAESLLQQQSQKVDQEMTDMKHCLQMHSQHFQNTIQEKQTILLEEVDRKQTTMKEEFDRHFEIFTKFVSNNVESQTGCLKRFSVQEMELMQQNLQRKIEDIAEPRETEANGAATSLDTGRTDPITTRSMESDTFPGQCQEKVHGLQPGQRHEQGDQEVCLNQHDCSPSQLQNTSISEVMTQEYKDQQYDTHIDMQAIKEELQHEEDEVQYSPVEDHPLISQPIQHGQDQAQKSLQEQYPKQVQIQQPKTEENFTQQEQTQLLKPSIIASSISPTAQSDISEDQPAQFLQEQCLKQVRMKQQQSNANVKHQKQTVVSKTGILASPTCSIAQCDISEDTGQTVDVQPKEDSLLSLIRRAKHIIHERTCPNGGSLGCQTFSRSIAAASLTDLYTLTSAGNGRAEEERSARIVENMPKTGIIFSIPQSDEFSSSGKEYLSLYFLDPSKVCVARVLARFDTKSQLHIDLLVSCGENADSVEWPLAFSSTGFIYNKTKANRPTPIWVAENRGLKRPAPGVETAVKAVVCLETVKADYTNVTYTELERRHYVANNFLQFSWQFHVQELSPKK